MESIRVNLEVEDAVRKQDLQKLRQSLQHPWVNLSRVIPTLLYDYLPMTDLKPNEIFEPKPFNPRCWDLIRHHPHFNAQYIISELSRWSSDFRTQQVLIRQQYHLARYFVCDARLSLYLLDWAEFHHVCEHLWKIHPHWGDWVVEAETDPWSLKARAWTATMRSLMNLKCMSGKWDDLKSCLFANAA